MGKKKKQALNKAKRQMKMQKAEKERDLMQEWKEWGRMWPLTAEGMEMIELEQAMFGESEGRHDMPTHETEPVDGATGLPLERWALLMMWVVIGVVVIGAIVMAMI